MRERTKIRKYTRIEKPFSSRFRVRQYEDRETPFPDWDTVALKNLSAGGMLFNCHKNLEVDSLLDLEIDMSESTPSINCVGKIIRIKESELSSMFDIAIEFTEIDKQEREMIYITAEKTLRKELKVRNFISERARAMVLDDNYILRTIIADVLKSRGYEVHGSAEPYFCPILLDRKCPCPVDTHCTDIIIIDINAPDMSALEFIEHQKSNGCKIQNVAVMSGSWTDKELEHAKRLGCHTFNKPFKIDEIKKWLDACENKLDPNSKLSDLPVSRQEVLSD
jgi:two-component system, response regulator, stage 0 sporulation protein F